MPAALLAALVSIDRTAGQVAAAIQAYEPQIYGLILLAALLWFFTFPKNDPDEI